MEWQPIESAPKDGTYVLIGNPKWEAVWQAYWETEVPLRNWHKEGWQRFNSRGQGLLFPTHWMPLPDAPKKGVDKAGKVTTKKEV